MNKKPFSREIILLDDVDKVVNSIVKKMQEDVIYKLKRKGAVIGISGGIDSSVCLALAVKAFGPENVLGVMLPEKDSSPESEQLAIKLAERFKVEAIKEEITSALAGFRCYERRDEAVKDVFPEYDPQTYKMKIGIKQSGLFSKLPPIFKLTIIDKDGRNKEKHLPVKEYLQIVAASNFKQRTRMSMLYYHAERLHCAVIGTPNKHEQEQGFFVKYGDGGADVMPIGNLYKTQVYQLAERWERDCLLLKPDVLSILIGVNDYWHMRNCRYDGTPEVYAGDYRALLQRTREALPEVKLILCEPFILTQTTAVDESWVEPFREYQEAAWLIAEEFGAIWVPFQAAFHKASEIAHPSYWAHDGVHPSMAGSQLMAETWLNAVG